MAAPRRRHRLQAGVGHYGIFNGRRWRSEILPDIADFICAARSREGGSR
ncbi:MAG: polyhydroxyalkanoate depolymerase, partial [Alphaproteobacteria bacterium]|nr:polyhydroxyalkanoate depolymerase [Alphaproteobacteria bacterium]